MDGLTAISARIGQIEASLASLNAPVRAPGAVPASGSPAISPSHSAASFATAMDAALGAYAPTTAPATQLNADGVPAELAAYGNGRVPREALEPVGGTGHRLWAPAAKSFEQLIAAAKADGITIGITDSYRSYDVQVDVVRRKGLYSEGGLGAKPGTSQHGWGMAVDLSLDAPAQAWMRTNAGRFGFVEDTPREPWHWAYKP